MKRQLLHLFFILFLATLCTAKAWGQATTITPTPPSGSGTSSSPYLIGTAAELFWFAQHVNTHSGSNYPNMGACAKLTADITINEGTFSCDESTANGDPSYAPLYNGSPISDDNAPIIWEPIGMGAKPSQGYEGTFDGNGKTVSGVYTKTNNHSYSATYYRNGLFSIVGRSADKDTNNSKPGTVKDLTIKNSYIGNENGGSGGIAGTFCMGTIENCRFEGTVISTGSYMGGAGGIVGSISCTQVNQSSTVVPQLLNCRNYGQVISKDYYAGGITSEYGLSDSKYGGIIKNCSNHGKVISVSDAASGLACVFGYYGSVENCYNTGEVSGGRASYGFFESNYSTITKCYNSGTLTGSSTANYSSNSGTISNCYSTAGSAQTGISIISDEDFKSGKFTYEKLNNNMDPDTGSPAWGQLLKKNAESYPTLGGQKVYKNSVSGADSYDNLKYVSSGSGDPYYRIDDAYTFRIFALHLNDEATYGTPATLNACLNADVDLSAEPWTPIGTAQKPYTGIFDGQHHLISGLRIENATTDAALIHTLGTDATNNALVGTVKNLGITTGNISTSAQAGVICVQNSGIISNCYSLIPVSGGSGSNAGALCSVNAGTIEYSFTTQPTLYGSTSGTVTNSYSLLPTATGADSETDGSTSGAKSEAFFKSGKMAWYLNGASSATLNWQQDLGPNPSEIHPRFYDGTGAHKVLRILLYNKLTTEGGTGTSYTYMNPQNYVLPTVTGHVVVEPLTKTGYHPGWSETENGPDAYESLGATITEDLTLYESWIANHFNVTYHANHSAAPGSTTTQELVYDKAGQSLAVNSFSRTGYTFHQWCTQSDNTGGQGTTYADQATQDTQGQININQLTATYPDGNVDLYALWTPNTYTVHFEANCPAELTSSGTMADQSHTYDTEQALTVNAFTCQGRTFIGWSTDNSATEPTYKETVTETTTTGAIVKNLTADVNGNVTLYAVWRHQALWIKFDPNRGEGDDNDDDKVSESAMEREQFISETEQAITQNTYTRPGYTFDGWKTDKSAETALYTDQQSVTLRAQYEGEEVTFYAHWKPIQYTVTVKSESIKKGSISIADENGAQISGSSYTTDYRNYILLFATPRNGYQFAQWSDGNTEVERVYRVPMNGVTLTAQFSEETKTVTIQTGSGSQEIQVGKDGTGLADALSEPNSIAIIEPNSGITVPAGLSNVIVKSSSTMGTCSNLVLTDKVAFSTPVKFTAESVTYTRNLTDYTYANGTDGWSTLLVPFDGTLYADEAPLTPFGSNADTNGQYWLKTFTGGISNGTLNFAYATQIKANQPYIIALPGDTWGSEHSLKGKTITVRATDVTISASPNPKESVGGDYSFTGTYDGLASATTCYQLNAAGNTFEKTGNAVEPFRCYLALLNNTLSAPMAFSIGDENGTVTGLQELPADGQGLRIYARNGNIIIEAIQPGTARIYSIDGRLIRTVNVEEGVNTVSGLTRGFYIVEKQKVILK